MKIRMTKAKERALHTAISLDDVLYEKFRRLNQRLHEDVERYYRNPKKVMRVLHKQADGNYLALQILDVHVTDQGTEVIVGGLPDSKKK